MRRAVVSEDEAQLRLGASVSGLAQKVPGFSARWLFSRAQRRAMLALLVALVLAAIFATTATAVVLASLAVLLYVCMVSYRFALFVLSTRADVTLEVTDDEARAVPDDELPLYTVLVPAFRESEVIHSLVEQLTALEYPRHRLQVMLLVEDDDDETIGALGAVSDADFEVVAVPVAEPRTKPKALNYGLTLARGTYVTVYDAEDVPDPLQLRRAVVAFTRVPAEVACLQAKLSYFNSQQNVITRWFTVEYAMWFSLFLPGLSQLRAPIPLGGTSNHFRRDVLRSMGAWDPFNVTEDADLGIRLYREGYRVAILESTTLEEANSDFVNWVRQRSRWYKGYLQTFFVHLRAPREFRRDVGWAGVAHFVLFVGGTPVLAMMNPLFWALTALWFIAHPHFLQVIFPGPVYYAGLLCWTLGNFLILYLTVLSARVVSRGTFLVQALVVPIYWVMMSMAAAKALWQLMGARTFWEKTYHGLHMSHAPSTKGVRGMAE